MVALSTNTLLWYFGNGLHTPTPTKHTSAGAWCVLNYRCPQDSVFGVGPFLSSHFWDVDVSILIPMGINKKIVLPFAPFFVGSCGGNFLPLSWAMIPYEPSSLKYLEHGEDKGDNYKR